MYVPDIIELIAQLRETGAIGQVHNVMEVGAQDVFATGFESSIDRFVRAFRPHVTIPDDCLTALSHGSARELYRFAGCNYSCMDVIKDPDNKYARLLFDVNFDHVPQVYKHKFDFVTNLGVTHHSVDQRNAFNVIHDLCVQNGYMFHYLPFTGRYDDLYFYHQPSFFEHLAKANNYELKGIWLFCTGDHLSQRSIFLWDDQLWKYIRPPTYLANQYHVIAALLQKRDTNSFCQPAPSEICPPPPSPGLAFGQELRKAIGWKETPVPVLNLFNSTTTAIPIWRPESKDFDGESLDLDTNGEFSPPLRGWGLIVNIGVSQDLLDQAAFFRRIHDATPIKACMAHVVPMLGYHRNGLFSYDIAFFEELAYVNGYDIIGRWLYLSEGLIPLQEEIYEHIQFPLDQHGEPMWMFILLRKIFSTPFQIPFQGFYKSIRDGKIGSRYFIARDNALFPDIIESWVNRSERVHALAEKKKNVVIPPEIFLKKNFDKNLVLRDGLLTSCRAQKHDGKKNENCFSKN